MNSDTELAIAVISGIFYCISFLCLLFTLIVYLVLPKLRDSQGRCIMMILFYSIIAAIIYFYQLVVIIHQRDFSTVCVTGNISVYALSSVLSWLVVLSFETWYLIAYPQSLANNRKTVGIASVLYGFGLPLIITAVPHIGHHAPGNHIRPFMAHTCLFQSYSALFLYYFLPLSILSIKSIIFVSLTGWTLRRKANLGLNNRLDSAKSKFYITLAIFLIINCTMLWLKVLALAIRTYIFWRISRGIASIEGLSLFLLLVVFRKQIRQNLKHKLKGCRWISNTWDNISDDGEHEVEEGDEQIISADKVTNSTCIYDCHTESVRSAEEANDRVTERNIIL